MQKIFILISILSFSVSSLFNTTLSAKIYDEKKHLNFLLITIDTLRADRLGCYGSKQVPTPNIDGLAENGYLFTKSFAHNPLTLPSHANILLGTTPLYHGVHDNVNFIIEEDFYTLAEHLKTYGYSTGAVVGASPLDSRFGLDQGFDFYDDEFKDEGSPKFTLGERKAEVVVEVAQEWLKEQEGPWFLWMHIWDPHFPYESPEPYLTRFKKQPYDGEIAYVDAVLGSFFDFMKEIGLSEKTLVIFTSDHGESLGQHGERTHGTLAYNTTIWVPLIISIPGQGSGKVDQLVSHTDIFPSVCDILGVEKPPFLQGISVIPALDGKGLPEHKIYFESLEPYYNFGWAPLRGYIYKKEKFFDSPIPELYSLENDFEEAQNIAPKKNIEDYEQQLEQTINRLTNPENIDVRNRPDRETLKRLKSLGYVGNPLFTRKEKYGPADDVKTLLPYYNKIADAYKLREERKIEEGIIQLHQIIKEQKRIYFAFTFLAKLYRESGQMKEALNILSKGMEIHPLCYEIVSDYSELLLEAGQFDRVIDILNSKSLIRMEHDPMLWNYLGLAYMDKRDSENAIKAFEMAISIDQEYADVFINLGKLYFSLYLKTKEKNTYKKSTHYFKKAIEVEPDNVEAYNGLGAAYMQQRRVDDAIYIWETAIKLKPNLIKTYYYLGLAYLTKEDYSKALKCLSEYKNKAYENLSPDEQKKLDSLIQKAKSASRKKL